MQDMIPHKAFFKNEKVLTDLMQGISSFWSCLKTPTAYLSMMHILNSMLNKGFLGGRDTHSDALPTQVVEWIGLGKQNT